MAVVWAEGEGKPRVVCPNRSIPCPGKKEPRKSRAHSAVSELGRVALPNRVDDWNPGTGNPPTRPLSTDAGSCIHK